MIRRLAVALGSGYLAEACAVSALVVALISVRTQPLLGYASVVLAILALVPLVTLGRQRYCVTGLFILIFASIGFVISAISIVMFSLR